MKQIWVYAEQQNGQWASATRELLTAARGMADTLGGEVAALVIGSDIGEKASSLSPWGVNKVYLVEHPELNYYNPLAYTEIIISLAEKFGIPEMMLFGATYLGQDLAPAVAARFNTGCAAHCCDLKLGDNGLLQQIIPGLGGSIFGTIVTPNNRPQVCTVKTGMLDVPEFPELKVPISMEIVKVDYQTSDRASAIQLSQTCTKPPREATLESAKVIVAGGAGMGSRENWTMLEELANALGAAVGGTRPAVDEGWIQHKDMIGSSGITVRPELYIGVGISGDMMHTVGIKGKGTRVAINNDPQAAIFKQVDFGIVGDFNEILPALIEEIRHRQAR